MRALVAWRRGRMPIFHYWNRPYNSRRAGRTSAVLRELSILLLIAALILVSFRLSPWRIYTVPSDSMEPTISTNAKILVTRDNGNGWAARRGEIVVFQDPGGWSHSGDSGDLLVKRVVGIPGDVVECCDGDGHLLVNGASIDETYIYAGDNPSDVQFEATVSKDHLWVMGDHRSNSGDSRANCENANGQVPTEAVIGSVSRSLAPWKSLTNYASVFAGIPESDNDVPVRGGCSLEE